MPALTYFTAQLNYLAASADVAAGPAEPAGDYDPQIQGINAGVTITAFLLYTDKTEDTTAITALPATTLTTPGSSLLALAPIRARIDNGQLKLRADPDLIVVTYPNLAGFPGAGNTSQLYRAADTGLVYKWTGSTYTATYDYAPVRLVAQTAVLGIPAGATLCYRFGFDGVTYGPGEQTLGPFAVAAATTDIVLDLAAAPRIKL